MAQHNLVKEFLGVGFRFPIQVDPATGRMQTSSYEDDIKEALHIILMTRKGERVMRPEFGCGIHDFSFGTTDYTSLCSMAHTVKEALILWEPRIKDVEVKVEPDSQEGGRLLVELSYVVRTTNNPYNLVYPFYMNEGFGE